LEGEDLGLLPPEEKTQHQFERFNKVYEAERVRMTQKSVHLQLMQIMKHIKHLLDRRNAKLRIQRRTSVFGNVFSRHLAPRWPLVVSSDCWQI
jgi:hypothetical protein